MNARYNNPNSQSLVDSSPPPPLSVPYVQPCAVVPDGSEVQVQRHGNLLTNRQPVGPRDGYFFFIPKVANPTGLQLLNKRATKPLNTYEITIGI